MVYPTYKVCKNVQVFETRQELLEYETAYSLFNQVYSATENGEWQVLHFVAMLMSSKLASQNDTPKTDSQIQLRGFRTRALGTLFHKMNNDLMTIVGPIPITIINFFLRGFRTRALGTLFHKMNNDLMTIGGPIPITVINFFLFWLMKTKLTFVA